jgi:hypothetical protein
VSIPAYFSTCTAFPVVRRIGERLPPFCDVDSKHESRCDYCRKQQSSGSNCKNCGAAR